MSDKRRHSSRLNTSEVQSKPSVTRRANPFSNEKNQDKSFEDEDEAIQTDDETEEEEPLTENDEIENRPKSSNQSVSNKSFGYTIPSLICLGFAFFVYLYFANDSLPVVNNQNWRSAIESNTILNDNQRATILASLKTLYARTAKQDPTVSTLLILSSNERNAAQLAQCLLQRINSVQDRKQLSTELDLPSYANDKLRLDTNLQSLLNAPDDSIRAVILRHIDALVSLDAFEQLRLLFAYCDGENPKISNRLIIMTATSSQPTESQLRETFRVRWPREHDFIDALMSRISGHTLFIQQNQTSFC